MNLNLWYQTKKKSPYSRYVTSSQDRLRNLEYVCLFTFILRNCRFVVTYNFLKRKSGFLDSGLFDLMTFLMVSCYNGILEIVKKQINVYF